MLLTGSRAYVREAVSPWSSAVKEVANCAMDDVGDVLAGLSKPRYGATLEVLLGSALCRFVVIPRPSGIHTDQEARAVLQSHASKKLGLKEAEWTLCVDNRMRRQLIGCAMRAATLARIHGWAAASHGRISSIRPLATTLSRAFKAQPFSLLEPDAVSMVSTSPAAFQIVSARLSDEDHDAVTERLRMSFVVAEPLPIIRFEEGRQGKLAQRDFSDLLVRA